MKNLFVLPIGLLWLSSLWATVLPFPRQLTMRAGPTLMELRASAQKSPLVLAKLAGIPGLEAHSTRPNLFIDIKKIEGTGPKFKTDESYTLDISSKGVLIHSPTEYGALHALETLKQIRKMHPEGLPSMLIKDAPRFPWRGLLMDPVRHWIGPAEIKKQLDFMAAVKLNVLHLHLSDDQGFRVESKELPKLHAANLDGKFFTQEEIREIVSYAAERGIRVVPEFDVPGHVTAMLSAYPELSSLKAPEGPSKNYGPHDGALNPIKQETYQFLEKLFTEMSLLFPDEFFHVGGDEVTGVHWSADPGIRAHMETSKIKDVVELQFMFTKKMEALVKRLGKKMIAWDEVLKEGGELDSAVQIWRGPKYAEQALSKKMPVIYSYGLYLDLQLSSETHYLADPAKDLGRSSDPSNLWGGEAALWTERVNERLLTERLWPRAMAVAERLWSPKDLKDPREFYVRQFALLDQWGIKHDGLLLEKIAKDSKDLGVTVEEAAELFTWLEPGRFYSQHRYKKITTDTALDQFVDVLPSEGNKATLIKWAFKDWQKKKDKKSLEALNGAFDSWLALGKVRKSIRSEGLSSLAGDIALCGRIGKEALAYLQGKERPGSIWHLENKTRMGMILQVREGMRPAMAPLVDEMIDLVAEKYKL